jgi:hypothetical protein
VGADPPTGLWGEGRHYSCRASSGGSVVLVNEAAEPVAAADVVLGRSFWLRLRLGRAEFERAMRSLAVVVVDVDTEHAFEMTAVQDQQPVQTLGAHGSDEAFRDRVRLRCPHRRLHDADAFAAEDLVARAAVLAVAVADQERTAWSEKSRPRLRACCAIQAPVGLAVQPASHTRRLPWAMKNNA